MKHPTSGMAGPIWGGVQLDIGRISLLNGAIDISKLEIQIFLNELTN